MSNNDNESWDLPGFVLTKERDFFPTKFIALGVKFASTYSTNYKKDIEPYIIY